MAAGIRLTLRTLLAYLDDTLEPEQAKAISQKIAESDTARKLIERIKAVTHNRQLPAPLVAGPGAKVDANVVAEYLDSVIEGQKLAQLEEIVLKSDVLLAEVAASHQILTMYLSQPGQVSPGTAERMANLLKDAKPGRKKKSAPAKPVNNEDEDDEDEEDSDDDISIGAPLTVRPRTVPLIPALLLLAVVGGLGWLVLQALTATPAETAHASGVTLSEPAATPTEPTAAKATETTETKAATTEKKEPPAATKKDEPPAKKEPPVIEKKEAIDKAPENRPSAERREAGQLAAPPATAPAALLRRGDAGPWQRVKPDEKVQTVERLLSLPGFRSKLLLASGVELTLFGQLQEFSSQLDPMLESSIILHVPETGFDADFTLDHGRVVLGNRQRGPAKVRVRFAGEIWDFTLEDAQSIAAVELLGIYPPEVPFRAQPGVSDGPLLLANAYGLKGQTELKIRYQTFALPTPSIFQWNNRHGPASGPQAWQLPPWFSESAPPAAARDFKAALDDLNARLNQKPVDIAVIELRKEAKPAAKILAVRALGAIDALGELLDALADENDPISRGQAILVLRMWIGRNAENETILHQLLGKKGYNAAQAEMIMELLHAFSREASENPTTYEKLIANLRHDKLAIRQLSLWHLMILVPEWQKIPYDPAGSPALREEGYQQWKKLIPDGKLPPSMKK